MSHTPLTVLQSRTRLGMCSSLMISVLYLQWVRIRMSRQHGTLLFPTSNTNKRLSLLTCTWESRPRKVYHIIKFHCSVQSKSMEVAGKDYINGCFLLFRIVSSLQHSYIIYLHILFRYFHWRFGDLMIVMVNTVWWTGAESDSTNHSNRHKNINLRHSKLI